MGARPMSWRALAALIALAGAACASSAASMPLSLSLPLALPSPAARAEWERIDGDYDTGNEHVRYSLFVDPARPLLYRITQYRVSQWVVDGRGHRRLDGDGETLIWNETPGRRAPLRCFAGDGGRQAAGRRLGPGAWRDVLPDTVEYRLSMLRAIQIYGQVRGEGRAGPSPTER